MEAVAHGFISSTLWPNVEGIDHIQRLFPRSVDELEAYTEKSLRDIEESFRKVVQVPSSLKDFENTFYAIDFAKALGQCSAQIMQVVAFTHSLSKVRDKALECLHMLQSVLIKYKGDKELYQACLCAKSNQKQSNKIQAMEEILSEFEREGAHLNREEWVRCITLKKEIKQIESSFLKNLDEDDTVLWILKSDLEGVSKKLVDSFEKRGDFCRVPCDTNTYYGVACFCENEKTRKRIYLTYNKRAHQKNLPLLQSLINKRNELANLLNYKTYAHLDISNQLAKTPEEANDFLNRIEEAVKTRAEKELAELLARIPGCFLSANKKILPWNMPYLYALGRGHACLEDDEELRQYFPLSEVFPKLLNYLESLFNLKLSLKHETIWEGANIRVEVRDENNALLGNILYDLYPRKGKYGHAVCIDVVPPLIINGSKTPALAVILVNISFPNAENFTLLTFDEISTLLHETGHALHAVLGACIMPAKAGYRTPTDFLEMPPILLENLIYERHFLQKMGKHYKTGEPVKKVILKNRKISKKYGSGYVLQGQTALSKLSLQLFQLKEGLSTTEVREQIYNRVQPSIALVENHHYEATFRHLADPLYGSKYYGFLYALAYSCEVYNKIQEDPKQEWYRFRKIVLEKGGSGSPLENLKIFLDKNPSIDCFIKDIS